MFNPPDPNHAPAGQAWVHPEPLDASPFLVDTTRQCVVSPRIGVSINGYERIEPEVFSLTAYEGTPDFDTRSKFNGLDFCREYGIEGIGFPASMVWIFNGDYWKKMTIAQIDKWFTEGHAEHFFPQPSGRHRPLRPGQHPAQSPQGRYTGRHLPVRPRTSRNRLWGTNGVIDWSAQAGPIRVLATTSPSP